MSSPFFSLNDLTINLPPNLDLKSVNTLEGFKMWDSFFEEILHHYAMLTTPQGIIMALLRTSLLTILGVSIFQRNKIEGNRLIIPLSPFYTALRDALRGSGTLDNLRGYRHITVNEYDIFVATLMNLNDFLYGKIEIDESNICPRSIKKIVQSIDQQTVIQGAEREAPFLEIQDVHGIRKRVPLGFHGIMEGYARTQINMFMKKVAELNPQFVKEFNKKYKDQILRVENLPHYLTWKFVKTQTKETDSNTDIIVMAVSYIALMHCEHIGTDLMPYFLRNVSLLSLDSAYREFDKFSHPGITFIEAFKSARKVLKENGYRSIDISELTNRICDDMKIGRPEVMLSKTRAILSRLLESMDPLYGGPGFVECIAKLALKMLDVASRDTRRSILGFVDMSEISGFFIKDGELFTNNPTEHAGWCHFVSLLDQILNSDRIVCFPKYMNGENTLCSNSTDCSKMFTPSDLCEKGFIECLGFIGDYKNIQSKSKPI
jgi:hypothetical protein